MLNVIYLNQRTFDGSLAEDSDTGFSVIPTIDDGYAVLGDTGSQSTGEWYTCLVKTDASGVEEWNHTFEDPLNSIIQIADGSFIISGDDFSLLKTDVNGQEIWNTAYGTSREEYLTSFIQTTDGGFLLIGTVGTVANDNDIWLLKTDMNGQQEWNTTLGGSYEDSVSSVVQVSDGGFVIAGSTQPAGIENRDMWLLKVKVSEDSRTPGFELGVFILTLSLLVLILRKRSQ